MRLAVGGFLEVDAAFTVVVAAVGMWLYRLTGDGLALDLTARETK